jgi:hypothetical protein
MARVRAPGHLLKPTSIQTQAIVVAIYCTFFFDALAAAISSKTRSKRLSQYGEKSVLDSADRFVAAKHGFRLDSIQNERDESWRSGFASVGSYHPLLVLLTRDWERSVEVNDISEHPATVESITPARKIVD